jgi:phage gpG-like protein
MPAQIQVKGARELRRTLKRAGVSIEDLKDANAAAGSIVVAAGRTTAPRRSGRLAGSIRASRAAASATVRAGGASVPYAGVIHWGWPGHHISARPWLSEAATSTESAWLAAYEAGVEKVLATIKGA